MRLGSKGGKDNGREQVRVSWRELARKQEKEEAIGEGAERKHGGGGAREPESRWIGKEMSQRGKQ